MIKQDDLGFHPILVDDDVARDRRVASGCTSDPSAAVLLAASGITALITVSLVMFGLWLVHLRIRNAGVVDIGWAANFALIALIYYFLGDGWPLRKILIAVMAGLWSLRLAFYLFGRTVGPEEEGAISN